MTRTDVFGLDGKAAVIIGGGWGMGSASCLALASVGASVAVVDVMLKRAEQVTSEIVHRGGTAHAIQADALDAAACVAAVESAAASLGRLDVLVNIVGKAEYSSLSATTVDLFDAQLSMNLRYVLTACQTFVRVDASGGPRSIVNIASISGLNSAPNHGAYGSAKAALMSLTRTMAQEWGPLSIRVNCIAPGAITTDRSQSSRRSRAVMARHSPLGRHGRQEEIAMSVLFLASNMASYITGHTLLVDGGVQTNYPFPQWN